MRVRRFHVMVRSPQAAAALLEEGDHRVQVVERLHAVAGVEAAA
jgi:hypothetical protein